MEKVERREPIDHAAVDCRVGEATRVLLRVSDGEPGMPLLRLEGELGSVEGVGGCASFDFDESIVFFGESFDVFRDQNLRGLCSSSSVVSCVSVLCFSASMVRVFCSSSSALV